MLKNTDLDGFNSLAISLANLSTFVTIDVDVKVVKVVKVLYSLYSISTSL